MGRIYGNVSVVGQVDRAGAVDQTGRSEVILETDPIGLNEKPFKATLRTEILAAVQ